MDLAWFFERISYVCKDPGEWGYFFIGDLHGKKKQGAALGFHKFVLKKEMICCYTYWDGEFLKLMFPQNWIDMADVCKFVAWNIEEKIFNRIRGLEFLPCHLLKGFALLKMMVAKNHRKPQSVIDVIPFFESARILKEKLSVADSINSQWIQKI